MSLPNVPATIESENTKKKIIREVDKIHHSDRAFSLPKDFSRSRESVAYSPIMQVVAWLDQGVAGGRMLSSAQCG